MYDILTCRFRFFAVGVLLMAVCGCATSIPKDSPLEKNWGRSYETQRFLQTANPDAGKHSEPVMVMDGPAADQVIDAYRQSFSSENEQETVNIIKLK